MDPEDSHSKLCPKCKCEIHSAFWERHVKSCVQNTWNCPVCTFENTAQSATCTICAQGKRPVPGRWNCRGCTFENPSTASKCQMCGSDKSKSVINREKKQAKEVKAEIFLKEAKKVKPPKNILNHKRQDEIRGRPPNVKQQSVNQQYRVDERADESGDAGVHSPAVDSIQQDEPINLYDDIDSDDLDIVEKKAEPIGKHRMHKDEEKSDERMEDIDFDWDMDKPKQKAEPSDADTMALIQQLLKAELCQVCQQQQGFDLHSDGVHRVCGSCGNKHLMRGLKTGRWRTQPLVCPIQKCEKPFPQGLISCMGCSEDDRNAILKMQDEFCKGGIRIISCPKCNAQYEAESASAQEAVQKNFKEFGLDNKPLSKEAIEHKAKCRFRCTDCATVFCADCGAMPYHIGFTCEGWQEYQTAKQCRFCGAQITDDNLAPFMEGGDGLMWVCRDDECLSKRNISCGHTLECGHLCRGIAGEQVHPRCLHPDCNKPDVVTGEDFCNICWVETLSQAPCVQLQCGHFFHFNCIQTKVAKRWPAARITFKFMDCPLCNKEIQHPKLKRLMKSSVRLKKEVSKQALERLRVEGLDKDERIKDRNSKYYKNPQLFALDRLAFYICFKCKQPYFGGMRRCEEAGAQQNEDFNEQHLVCGSCASGPNSASCKIHGKQFITYKCKFCCSVANWFCWGNTHFCTDCHKKQEQGDYLNRKPISALPKCPGRGRCPLGLSIEHPPNGTKEFSLGCVVCLRK